MKDWISLFEKYRIDRRLYDLHRSEYSGLSPLSPRKPALEAEIARLEHSIYSTELLLSRYDSQVSSPKDALQRADERLFLACHYINGLSMEATADQMCISRDTVYRIRRRIMQRGAIPTEIYDLCQLSVDEEGNLRDTRQSVQNTTAVREACFAGNPCASLPSVTPPRKRSDYPDFLFSSK